MPSSIGPYITCYKSFWSKIEANKQKIKLNFFIPSVLSVILRDI